LPNYDFVIDLRTTLKLVLKLQLCGQMCHFWRFCFKSRQTV